MRGFFHSNRAAERERWPLWLPATLGAGACSYFALPAEPPLALGWVALVLALAAAGLKCDGVGCVVVKGRILIAASLRPEALAEDCARAAVVVSAAQATACKGPAVVIDQKAAATGEGWRITLSSPATASSVRAHRGDRPWVVSNAE